MGKERRVVYATVRIEFTAPDGMGYEACDIAQGLAINPNYNSMLNGVELENVQVVFDQEVYDGIL